MQKFPDDSMDEIEKRYADIILAGFPSYKEFWEKFVGLDKTNKVSFLPRKPVFPEDYGKEKGDDFRGLQHWLSSVTYSLFCNLAGAYYHFCKYKEFEPKSKEKIFEILESYECSYLHLGNIIYILDSLFGKLKNNLIIDPKYRKDKEITHWLGDNNKDENWLELNDEPKKFRDSLVHNGFRGIFTVIDGEIYFPLKTDKDKVLWSDMEFEFFVTGTYKLETHINLAFKTCEDVYNVFIKTLDDFIKNEEIEI